MKYLKKFEIEADKKAWLESDEFASPNVVLVEGKVEYDAKIDYSTVPLHITAIKNLTVSFNNTGEYSKDNKNWTSYASNTNISAKAGEKVYFRASGLTPNVSTGIGTFYIYNGTCKVAGNVMSMVYGAEFNGKSEITQKYQFYKLFLGASMIVDASDVVLPATTLAERCYWMMFKNCTSLVTAPRVLPATAKKSHEEMFNGCTSLVNAPELPATTLSTYCYSSMFKGCTSLVNAPELPATTLSSDCYSSMFNGCTSLVNAPELPATTLSTNCYNSMFNGCSNLSYIKMLATDVSATYCLSSWVKDVAATGTFVKNSAATWNKTGIDGVPEGWTVETASA